MNLLPGDVSCCSRLVAAFQASFCVLFAKTSVPPSCFPSKVLLPWSHCLPEPQTQPGSTTGGGSWMGGPQRVKGRTMGTSVGLPWAAPGGSSHPEPHGRFIAPPLWQSTKILAELYFQSRFQLFSSRPPTPVHLVSDCLATLSGIFCPTHGFLDKFRK